MRSKVREIVMIFRSKSMADHVIPASVANTEFGKLLPSLADGTCTPEQFAQWMSDKAAEASAE